MNGYYLVHILISGWNMRNINCSLSNLTTTLNRALALLPFPDDLYFILQVYFLLNYAVIMDVRFLFIHIFVHILILVPTLVTSLLVTDVSTTTITVNWTSPSSKDGNYVMYYNTFYSPFCMPLTTVNVTLVSVTPHQFTTTFSFILRKLFSGMNYIMNGYYLVHILISGWNMRNT